MRSGDLSRRWVGEFGTVQDLRLTGPGGRQGPKDVTRRLAPFGDSGFVHMLQVNERDYERTPAPFSWSAPPAYLIRYGLDAEPRDTLAVMAGAPTLRYQATGLARTTGQQISHPRWTQPLFSGRPVWATGDGWLALGHGDSSHVVVRKFRGDTLMIVRWAPDRVPVSLEDRREASTWVIVHRVLNSSRVREFLDNESAQGFSQGVDFDIEHYHSFAEFAPTVAAAYGVGHCLFLAGFSPTDWADGTALTWVVVDVGRGSLEAVLRLSPPGFVLEGKRLNVERIGAAVRAFGPQFAYTTSRRNDGVFLVDRYPVPSLSCAQQ